MDLYEEEYDPERPVVCFDETSKQLIGHTRMPIAAASGRLERQDYEYERNGARNLFMLCEPKGGWRHVEVTERRTAVDFAERMRWLVDQAYPDTGVIRLVLDNLNTHKKGSLYEAFEPSEARRIARRLEFHHTPKHGSWLNMAEIEFSVFSRQCLRRRIGDESELRRQIAALEQRAQRIPLYHRLAIHRSGRSYETQPHLPGAKAVNRKRCLCQHYMDLVLEPLCQLVLVKDAIQRPKNVSRAMAVDLRQTDSDRTVIQDTESAREGECCPWRADS